MKIFMLLFLLVAFCNVHAGVLVDDDEDGLYCVLENGENDGDPPIKFCGEDDQDKCDGIPNISRDDFHCSVDVNNDGVFDSADIRQVRLMPDHFLGGGYGGFVCYYYIRVIEYNRRLRAAGLLPLQLHAPFDLVEAGGHCFGHHTPYPPIL